MAPSGESFRNTFFFLRMVQSFYRRYLQNTTNDVMGTRTDHDRIRYEAYSVKIISHFKICSGLKSVALFNFAAFLIRITIVAKFAAF